MFGGKLLAALRADHLIETDPAHFSGRNDFAALWAYRIQRSEDSVKIHFLSRGHARIFSQEKSPTGGTSLGKWRSVFFELTRRCLKHTLGGGTTSSLSLPISAKPLCVTLLEALEWPAENQVRAMTVEKLARLRKTVGADVAELAPWSVERDR